MRLFKEIRADINKAKAKVTSVELEIGHTTGVSSQINRLIQAQNLLTYCHSRLSDIDPESLRPKGEWIDAGRGIKACSLCNHGIQAHMACVNHFCPNCGAENMKGGQDNA